MFQKLWRIHTNPFILDHIGPLHLPQAHHQLLLHQHQPPGDNSFSPKFSITISPLNWEFSSLSSDHVNSPLLGLSPKGDILPLHNHPILLHLVRGDLHLEGNLRDGNWNTWCWGCLLWVYCCCKMMICYPVVNCLCSFDWEISFSLNLNYFITKIFACWELNLIIVIYIQIVIYFRIHQNVV